MKLLFYLRTDTSIGLVAMDLNRKLIKGKTKLEWQDGHSAFKYTFDIKHIHGGKNRKCVFC